jgi:hypothetical protein
MESPATSPAQYPASTASGLATPPSSPSDEEQQRRWEMILLPLPSDSCRHQQQEETLRTMVEGGGDAERRALGAACRK